MFLANKSASELIENFSRCFCSLSGTVYIGVVFAHYWIPSLFGVLRVNKYKYRVSCIELSWKIGRNAWEDLEMANNVPCSSITSSVCYRSKPYRVTSHSSSAEVSWRSRADENPLEWVRTDSSMYEVNGLTLGITNKESRPAIRFSSTAFLRAKGVTRETLLELRIFVKILCNKECESKRFRTHRPICSLVSVALHVRFCFPVRHTCLRMSCIVILLATILSNFHSPLSADAFASLQAFALLWRYSGKIRSSRNVPRKKQSMFWYQGCGWMNLVAFRGAIRNYGKSERRDIMESTYCSGSSVCTRIHDH